MALSRAPPTRGASSAANRGERISTDLFDETSATVRDRVDPSRRVPTTSALRHRVSASYCLHGWFSRRSRVDIAGAPARQRRCVPDLSSETRRRDANSAEQSWSHPTWIFDENPFVIASTHRDAFQLPLLCVTASLRRIVCMASSRAIRRWVCSSAHPSIAIGHKVAIETWNRLGLRKGVATGQSAHR